MNRQPTGTSDECDICEGFIRFWLMFYSRDFHKLDEIGSNANIGIRGFTTWKQKKISGRTRASHEPLIPSPMLSFRS